MKKWNFIFVSTFLVGLNAFCSPYVSLFDGYGKITITDSPPGLKTDMNLQLDPRQKYKIKYLSSCRTMSPYVTQFRHSFEIVTTSDNQGKIQQISYFSGMHMADLKSRNLNTVALYQQEKSQWKMLKCVALSDSQSDSSDLQNNKQRP